MRVGDAARVERVAPRVANIGGIQCVSARCDGGTGWPGDPESGGRGGASFGAAPHRVVGFEVILGVSRRV